MWHYGKPRDEDMPALAALVSWAFGFPAAEAEPWFAAAGPANLRVLCAGGEPLACLLLIPMGQFFGGRSVPCTGVAGVATAPEHRGSGVATRLLHETVRELNRAGVALSALYPATRPLYRRAGYEPAGGRFAISLPTHRADARETGGEVRLATLADRAAMAALYRECAGARPGYLDRGAYIWRRVFEPRGQTTRAYLARRDGELEGYAVLYEQRAAPPRFDLFLTDLVARTGWGARRLLALLGAHATTASSVTWYGGPADPFVQALPEIGYELRLHDHWMLRVTDVAAALEGRGYPAGARAELHLDVHDDLLPENRGRFVLEVADGVPRVARGGRGEVELDIRGLAPLYTGHLSPSALAALDLVRGPEAALRVAGALFAGGWPAMPDMF